MMLCGEAKKKKKKKKFGTGVVALWLGLHAAKARGPGSILGKRSIELAKRFFGLFRK